MKLLSGPSNKNKKYGSTENEDLTLAPLLSDCQPEDLSYPNASSHQQSRRIRLSSDADDTDRSALPWSWPRRIKVALLTLLLVLMTVLLLFLPEEAYNERVVTVTEDDPVVYDLDRAYRQQGRDSEKIMRVRIDGSFIPEEATNLARFGDLT